MQDARFLQQRDEESGPLGCYSGSKSQLEEGTSSTVYSTLAQQAVMPP